MLAVGLDVKPTQHNYEALRDEFLNEYESALDVDSCLFEGVPALLDALEDSGLPWGIVTNKAMRFTAPVLAALGLHGRASVVIAGDTTPFSKPHPEPLFEACRRLQLVPAQAVYVGDDLRDVQAARAAGMPVVAAGYGYLGEDRDVTTWQADEVIDSPQSLLDLLGRPRSASRQRL